MRRVGVAGLKDNLSQYLRAVEGGDEIEVTDRDRPIVRSVPIAATTQVAVKASRKPFAAIRSRTYPKAGWAIDSTGLLLEERQRR